MIKINNDYQVNDILEFKKPHPCGGKMWLVLKYGVDCKLRCTTCGHEIIISRVDISKRLKNVIKENKND